MTLSNLIIFSLPTIASLVTSKFCPMGKEAGVKINARPPPYVFAVVWTILYILMGLSWVTSRNCKCKDNNIIDTLYVTLIVLLNFWVVKYGCNKDKKGALYILPFTILVTLILIVYSLNTISSYLLLPLLVWLIFAMLLNYTEVNEMPPPSG
jgi:benzodiazapine receptor